MADFPPGPHDDMLAALALLALVLLTITTLRVW